MKRAIEFEKRKFTIQIYTKCLGPEEVEVVEGFVMSEGGIGWGCRSKRAVWGCVMRRLVFE